jgi:hypothetical protein
MGETRGEEFFRIGRSGSTFSKTGERTVGEGVDVSWDGSGVCNDTAEGSDSGITTGDGRGLLNFPSSHAGTALRCMLSRRCVPDVDGGVGTWVVVADEPAAFARSSGSERFDGDAGGESGNAGALAAAAPGTLVAEADAAREREGALAIVEVVLGVGANSIPCVGGGRGGRGGLNAMTVVPFTLTREAPASAPVPYAAVGIGGVGGTASPSSRARLLNCSWLVPRVRRLIIRCNRPPRSFFTLPPLLPSRVSGTR